MSVEGWIGIAFGIFGIAVAFWICNRTKNHRVIWYAQLRRDLISDDAFSMPSGRVITVDGQAVRRLYREFILIRSAGNKSIRFLNELNSIALTLPDDSGVISAEFIKMMIQQILPKRILLRMKQIFHLII